MMARIHLIVAALSVLLALVSATCECCCAFGSLRESLADEGNEPFPAAPSFCKCTCFKNSTIIPLNPPHEQTPSDGTGGQSVGLARRWSPASDGAGALQQDWAATEAQLDRRATGDNTSSILLARAGAASCSRCNRAYCLSSGLPICRDAEEKDVVAACFQRDSRKDQIIVWCFLIGTSGLLGWAAVKHLVAARAARATAALDSPLGGHGGRRRAESSPGFFRRVADILRISRRGSGAGGSSGGGGGNAGGLRNPFSPRTTELRGQYSPLAGGVTD
ncbi:hypothetical protein CMQ_2472 [Grosmannia clavigera kw1407]|uniref:Integral membrane protein n=1 Tax=Grosmannia clavigera (strain kw1407 / UAMH 11150) TaxID=655863 RepID=F0XJD9_GROCL|nr:uncharacterized protein CMQ_2472 [Grosmannia clavigera kw1407]EFX02423.1 hypothetical protein CMQ_2472 [Grosmannia clavigera kw1407]